MGHHSERVQTKTMDTHADPKSVTDKSGSVIQPTARAAPPCKPIPGLWNDPGSTQTGPSVATKEPKEAVRVESQVEATEQTTSPTIASSTSPREVPRVLTFQEAIDPRDVINCPSPAHHLPIVSSDSDSDDPQSQEPVTTTRHSPPANLQQSIVLSEHIVFNLDQDLSSPGSIREATSGADRTHGTADWDSINDPDLVHIGAISQSENTHSSPQTSTGCEHPVTSRGESTQTGGSMLTAQDADALEQFLAD